MILPGNVFFFSSVLRISLSTSHLLNSELSQRRIMVTTDSSSAKLLNCVRNVLCGGLLLHMWNSVSDVYWETFIKGDI